MLPEAVEAVVDSCFRRGLCDVNHLSGNFGDSYACRSNSSCFWHFGATGCPLQDSLRQLEYDLMFL